MLSCSTCSTPLHVPIRFAGLRYEHFCSNECCNKFLSKMTVSTGWYCEICSASFENTLQAMNHQGPNHKVYYLSHA